MKKKILHILWRCFELAVILAVVGFIGYIAFLLCYIV